MRFKIQNCETLREAATILDDWFYWVYVVGFIVPKGGTVYAFYHGVVGTLVTTTIAVGTRMCRRSNITKGVRCDGSGQEKIAEHP